MTYNELLIKINEVYGESAKYLYQNSHIKQELDHVDWAETRGSANDYTYEYAWNRIKEEAEIMLHPFNVKVGDGVTICLWSDRHAATVIKVTKSSVTVRQDKATLDPNFKPEWVDGGFDVHCVNQGGKSYT